MYIYCLKIFTVWTKRLLVSKTAQKLNEIPQGEKRKTKEKSQRPANLRDERDERIDKVLPSRGDL